MRLLFSTTMALILSSGIVCSEEGLPLVSCADPSRYKPRSIRVVQFSHIPPGPADIDHQAHGGWQSLYQVAPAYNRLLMQAQGLSYTLVRASQDLAHHRNRSHHHVKPFVLADVLRREKEADTIVFMDVDVIISHADQNLTCLLEHWGWYSENEADKLFMMARDPDAPFNYAALQNGSHVLNVNTGFIVIRNKPEAMKYLKLWAEETHNNTTWNWKQFYDQSIFNVLVRPHLEAQKLIKVLPCDDANGFKWLDAGRGCCDARFVTHGWGGKHLIQATIESRLPLAAWRYAQLQRNDVWSLSLDMEMIRLVKDHMQSERGV
jgi:hypothetical protein